VFTTCISSQSGKVLKGDARAPPSQSLDPVRSDACAHRHRKLRVMMQDRPDLIQRYTRHMRALLNFQILNLTLRSV
jgi:hypothetical protein